MRYINALRRHCNINVRMFYNSGFEKQSSITEWFVQGLFVKKQRALGQFSTLSEKRISQRTILEIPGKWSIMNCRVETVIKENVWWCILLTKAKWCRNGKYGPERRERNLDLTQVNLCKGEALLTKAWSGKRRKGKGIYRLGNESH
jgi:hypothetical protein